MDLKFTHITVNGCHRNVNLVTEYRFLWSTWGYLGRIRLHALPGAIAFYKKLRIGLLDCGSDPDEPDNLVYFETLRR